MTLNQYFTDQQLMHIIDESSVYVCACPAQVARHVLELRSMFGYQAKCLTDQNANRETHTVIIQAARENHARMEQCLKDILTMERWDQTTLTMPQGLRQLRHQLLEK